MSATASTERHGLKSTQLLEKYFTDTTDQE